MMLDNYQLAEKIKLFLKEKCPDFQFVTGTKPEQVLDILLSEFERRDKCLTMTVLKSREVLGDPSFTLLPFNVRLAMRDIADSIPKEVSAPNPKDDNLVKLIPNSNVFDEIANFYCGAGGRQEFFARYCAGKVWIIEVDAANSFPSTHHPIGKTIFYRDRPLHAVVIYDDSLSERASHKPFAAFYIQGDVWMPTSLSIGRLLVSTQPASQV